MELQLMRHFCTLIAAVILIAPAASGTSIHRVPPHQTKYASCAVQKLIDSINHEWAYLNDRPLDESFESEFPNLIYTDYLGKASSVSVAGHGYKGKRFDELDFVESLRKDHGKEDKGVIEATKLVRLTKDKISPSYLLQLRRNKWEVYQVLPTWETREGYEMSISTWLVQYSGNDISLLRQVDELSNLADGKKDRLTMQINCNHIDNGE